MTEQTLQRSPQADFDAESFEQAGSEDFASVVGIQSEPESNGVSTVNEPSVTKVVGWGSESDGADIDYVPVSPWAPIALCIGLLGLTGFIGYFGLYVAFFGIFVGIGAISQIRSSGQLKGTWMATLGLILSICSFSLGAAKMSYDYKHEVPDGYLRVRFPKDVAEKQFVFFDGRRKLHPDVAPLVGKKVYLKGFMYATQATEGLRQFILLKDNGECCFGGKPKSHDYIIVTLPELESPSERPAISNRASGMSVIEASKVVTDELSDEEDKGVERPDDTLDQHQKYQLVTRAFMGMVAVAGVLEADVRAGEGGPPADFEFAPVYTMKNVELVEEAWTRF